MKYLMIAILFGFSFLPSHVALAKQSVCYGTTKNGHLTGGVKLPNSGNNFLTYSYAAALAGRTYVHDQVRDIILEAYQRLEKTQPGKVFKFAETGFEQGGRFKPHKTHQNGLSVDFVVPVTGKNGHSAFLPTTLLNRYGYDIEFSKQGRYKSYSIDYEALAAHIVALHKASKSRGYDIWRVIFAPEFQPHLFKTKYGPYLKRHIQFSKRRSWVWHDEHYHVDFSIPCKKR